MTLKERTWNILEASVRDFIETGNPVTSERLYRKYDFGIKPAMIRWELHDLAKEDYLSQNHPSGGRIPSDKAYKFFVKEVQKGIEKEKRERGREAQNLIELLLEGERKKFVQTLAKELKLLGACYDTEEEEFHGSGFGELVGHLDTAADIGGIVEDFEMIPERLMEERDWWEEEKDWPRVFIGKNPFTRSRYLSVIISRVRAKNGESTLILAMGPKRMDYEHSLRLFREIF
ncbi:MAG: hypothetical protein Q8P01_04805 [bacterium]|nr:hypothetical protein [bacterium]